MAAIYPAPVYDLGELARCNLHVHTTYSGCAKPEMTVPAILAAAEAAGVELLALTDHYNDEGFDAAFLGQIDTLRAQVEKTGSSVRVLYGAELSAYGVGRRLELPETARALDYRLYTANHYHLDFWEQPEDRSPRGYALHQIALLSELMRSGLADCIAHPIIGKYIRTFDPRALTAAMTDEELFNLSRLAAAHHVAWELNTKAVPGDPVFFQRLWTLGREAGAYFHYGTDAHRLDAVSARADLDAVRRVLESA